MAIPVYLFLYDDDESSNGCIIAPLSVRKAIYNSGDTELIVR